jgi:hypothetical protein
MSWLANPEKERQKTARARANSALRPFPIDWHYQLAAARADADHLALGYDTFEEYCEREIVEQLPAEHQAAARRLVDPSERGSRRSIYFVQPAAGGLIKIGIASNVAARLSGMQTGSPVELRVIGVIAGVDQSFEAELHERYASARRHGEWFEPTAELLDYIAEHAEVPA